MKNDYYKIIEKMNTIKINYSLTFEYKDPTEIKFLSNYEIDFNHIKQLAFNQ